MFPLTFASQRQAFKLLSGLCSLDQSCHSFQAYAVSIEEYEQSQKSAFVPGLLERNNMTHIINRPIPKLRKASQPPLSYPGATPDSDRAKKPALSEPTAPDSELTPGDRVEGLGNFGKPTGEFGTVERANEEDAVVKWDENGRTRLHQPSLRKI